ncbi:MAG: MFS transporter [Asgard group archaeon]|nr:MFS transporter [Asgard group archaeon]
MKGRRKKTTVKPLTDEAFAATETEIKHTSRKQQTNIKITSWLASTSIKATSDSIISPFIPLYGKSIGYSNTKIGLIVSITSLLSIFQIFWAQIAQKYRVSRIIAFVTNYLGASFNFLYLTTQNAFGFAAIRGTQSIIASGSIPTSSAIFAERTPSQSWGFWNSLIQGMIVLGTIIGTLLGGIMLQWLPETKGFTIVFICGGAVSLLSALIFQISVPSQRKMETSRKWMRIEEVDVSINNAISMMKTDKNYLVFILVNFIFVLGVNLSGPFYIIFNTADYGYNLSVFETSILTAVGLIPQMISSIITSRFIEKVRKKELVIVGGLMTSFFPVLYLIPYFTGRTTNVLWILIIMWSINGLAWGVINSSLTTLALDIFHPRRRTLQIAINNSLNSVALFIAPILGGFILEKASIAYLLFILSAAGRFIGILLFILVKEPIIGGTILRPISKVLPFVIRSNAEKQIISLVAPQKSRSNFFSDREEYPDDVGLVEEEINNFENEIMMEKEGL